MRLNRSCDWKRWGWGLGVGVVLGGFCLAGCTLKGGPGTAQFPVEIAEAWRIRPVKMRVFPTTALVREKGRWYIEAAVEFLDEMGDTTKAVGGLRFELWEGWGPAERREQRMLESWECHLLTRRQNREHYDSLTRTYRFRLEGRGELPADRLLRLVVMFRAVEGEVLTAEGELESGQAQEVTAR